MDTNWIDTGKHVQLGNPVLNNWSIDLGNAYDNNQQSQTPCHQTMADYLEEMLLLEDLETLLEEEVHPIVVLLAKMVEMDQ